jgi:hypothetical protein
MSVQSAGRPTLRVATATAHPQSEARVDAARPGAHNGIDASMPRHLQSGDEPEPIFHVGPAADFRGADRRAPELKRIVTPSCWLRATAAPHNMSPITDKHREKAPMRARTDGAFLARR